MIPDLELYRAYERQPESLRYCQRALWHDYHSPRIYMVTLMKHPGIANFSFIKGSVINGKVYAIAQPLRLGHHIQRAIIDWQKRFPFITSVHFVRMPDHLHILFYVSQYTQYHLDDLIQDLVDDIDRRHCYILNHDHNLDFNGHVFLPAYHDRILSGEGQLPVLHAYIEDNPRRLFLRRNFPEYFNSVMLMANEEGLEFSAFGNLCLLDHPHKTVVRFSRRFTADEMAANRRRWEETIRSRGVLVSPFIHPTEKEYLHKAIAEGGRAVILTSNGFAPRWKPSGGFIDATAEGRLLFLGPTEYLLKEPPCTREQSMRLNAQAELIASLPPGTFRPRPEN